MLQHKHVKYFPNLLEVKGHLGTKNTSYFCDLLLLFVQDRILLTKHHHLLATRQFNSSPKTCGKNIFTTVLILSTKAVYVKPKEQKSVERKYNA